MALEQVEKKLRPPEGKEVAQNLSVPLPEATNIDSLAQTLEEGALNVLGNITEAEGKRPSEQSSVAVKSGGATRSTGTKSTTTYDFDSLFRSAQTDKKSRVLIVKTLRTEIHKEIQMLSERAQKLKGVSAKNFNPHELSNIYAKMRELSATLFTLVRLPLDKLKDLWVRFVHRALN